jgi:hypothetical protein
LVGWLRHAKGAADPALPERAAYTVANLEARDVLANRDHLADAIRQGDQRQLERGVIGPVDDLYVAVVQRRRADVDQDLCPVLTRSEFGI